jgi:hypothetical protein
MPEVAAKENWGRLRRAAASVVVSRVVRLLRIVWDISNSSSFVSISI